MIENKTSKYFKYAIGEIILVVIGILIALQINNWNDERLGSIQTNKILKELQSEIKEDKTLVLSFIELNEARNDNNSHLSDFLFNKNKKIDSTKLKKGLLEASRIEFFLPKKKSFETIINSGFLNNINNTILKNNLIDYYETSTFEERILPQIEIYALNVSEHRFKYLPQNGFRNQLIAQFKGEEEIKIFYENLKLPWLKIKSDEALRKDIDKIIGLTVAIDLTMKEQLKKQDSLINLLDKYLTND